jgi:hypothetical protein
MSLVHPGRPNVWSGSSEVEAGVRFVAVLVDNGSPAGVTD